MGIEGFAWRLHANSILVWQKVFCETSLKTCEKINKEDKSKYINITQRDLFIKKGCHSFTCAVSKI